MIDVRNYRFIFDSVLSLSEEGIAVAGPDGIIEAVNRQFADFLDIPEEAIIGKTAMDLIPDMDQMRTVPVKNDVDETVAFLVYAQRQIHDPDTPEKVLAKKNMTLHERVDAYEKEVILEILERCGYNYTQAAKEAGVHRSLLYKKTAKYRIRRATEEKKENKTEE